MIKYLIGIIVALLISLILFQGNEPDIPNVVSLDQVKASTEVRMDTQIDAESKSTDWRSIELNDIRTSESFSIADFEGKSILLESFAVWCPTCKKQQDKIKELHEELGDSVISISLDIDPSEDAQRIKGHYQRHGYQWYFAISPEALSQALVDEFGLNVVNAPAAPVVLICEDQQARLLDFGVKSSDTLAQEISKGC